MIKGLKYVSMNLFNSQLKLTVANKFGNKYPQT